MTASETRIPVSKDTRREIRLVKVREDLETYDEAVRSLLEDREIV